MENAPNLEFLSAAVEAADEIGIKIEMVGGIPVWEAFPNYRHQSHVKRIDASVRRPVGAEHDCGCVSAMDVAIRFPDGSFKRPDIAIFCSEPEEQDSVITKLPEAVIEVLSKGYEAKDLQFGLPFYIQNGIKDVVILDPSNNRVIHARNEAQQELVSPVTIELECGCVVTV